MGKRDVDICFSPTEKLWRSVDHGGVDHEARLPKPGKLRLQISTSRESKCAIPHEVAPGTPPHFNGLLEIEAQHARGELAPGVHVVVVDEPTKDFSPHALIAFVSDAPPGGLSEGAVSLAREILAGRMKVVTMPTKK